jgi:hypothetical protein
MSARTATWLAWSMCALSLALAALSLLLLYLNYSHPGVPIWGYWMPNILITVGFSTVGAVIAPRLPPDNPIGWVFCAIGLLIGVTHFSAQYAIYALLAVPGSLPAGEAVAWILTWVWIPGLGLSTFQFLLFPDGRLPSRRWRWFAWLSLLLIIVGMIWQAFAPGLVQGGDAGGIYNPLGVEGLPNVGELIQTLLFALMLISAASLFVRLVRASGVERQQLKWFAYVSALSASSVILTYTISEAIGSVWLRWAGEVMIVVALLGTPIAMGIAILRYRLYEIDLLINRTLVYGSLTAMLAVVYFGGVATTQAIFRALTGQEQQPQLAIVVSTLVIAALFNPLRRRIQAFIDRRFYRRKYNAAKTLEAFSAKLRDETDLEALNNELVGVVRETMQPAHVSLWLRPDTASKDKQAD